MTTAFFDDMPNILAPLPPKAAGDWDTRLFEAERSLGPTKDECRDWKRRAKLRRIIGLRQAIADHRGDVDAFIALENAHLEVLRDTNSIAERLYEVGRYQEALKWVRKGSRAGVEFTTCDDLADVESPSDPSDFAPKRLEIWLLEAMGDHAGTQDLSGRLLRPSSMPMF